MNRDWKQSVRERLAVLRLPPEREIAIVEELALHLEAIYEDVLADGLSQAEAQQRALQSYDWRLLECELSRVERRWQPPVATVEWLERKGGMRMESLWQDLRFGARMLFKRPGFTLIAVSALALVMGSNTAIFSVIDAVLLRPFPYQNSDRLCVIWKSVPARNIEWDWTSYPTIRDWREQSRAFEEMAAVLRPEASEVNWQANVGIEKIQGSKVTGNFFEMLGVAPLLGRAFSTEEARQGADVAVLSYGFC